MPLDWATATGVQGVVLAHLAERTADATMAARAVEQIAAAWGVVRDSGHRPWAAYFEAHLEFARAVLNELTNAEAAAP